MVQYFQRRLGYPPVNLTVFSWFSPIGMCRYPLQNYSWGKGFHDMIFHDYFLENKHPRGKVRCTWLSRWLGKFRVKKSNSPDSLWNFTCLSFLHSPQMLSLNFMTVHFKAPGKNSIQGLWGPCWKRGVSLDKFCFCNATDIADYLFLFLCPTSRWALPGTWGKWGQIGGGGCGRAWPPRKQGR